MDCRIKSGNDSIWNGFPLPDGQITWPIYRPSVQPLVKKYSDFQKSQISPICSPSRPSEGRFAIVTDAGRDAVAAGSAEDESAFLRTAKSYGPDASTLASSLRETISACDGDKKSPIAGESTT
jgi:hypothetical protein